MAYTDHNRTLTTGEAAAYCGVNFRTVSRWIERGLLQSFKLPGRGDHRIPIKEFVRFLNTNNIPIPDELGDFGNGCILNAQRVLVVDDDRAMTAAIARVLRREGYKVQCANDGFQAGALLTEFKPAMMTLDLRMPGLDGFSVLKFIRSQPHLKDMRVLVISALGEAQLQLARATGADAVIAKPFDNNKLIKIIFKLKSTLKNI